MGSTAGKNIEAPIAGRPLNDLSYHSRT